MTNEKFWKNLATTNGSSVVQYSPSSSIAALEVHEIRLEPVDVMPVKNTLLNIQYQPNNVINTDLNSHGCPKCSSFCKIMPQPPAVIINTTNPYQCSLCHEILTSESWLIVHIREYHAVKGEYQCMQCKHVYYRSYDIIVRHNDNEKPYQCVSCASSFWTLDSFIDHSRTCISERSHNAAKVGIPSYFQLGSSQPSFPPQSHRGYSIADHFPLNNQLKSMDRRNQCMICGRCFSQRSSLTRHMKILHSGVNTSVCTVCGVSFNKAEFLAKHMVIHARRMQCEKCNAQFLFRQDFTKHMKRSHKTFYLNKMFKQLRGKAFVNLKHGNYMHHFL